MATAALSRSYGSQLIASLKTNSSPELHSLEEMENIPYFDIEGAFFDNQFVYDLGPLLSQNLSTYLTSIELNGDVHHLYPGCQSFFYFIPLIILVSSYFCILMLLFLPFVLH